MRVRWPDRGHFQMPPRIEQRTDAQSTGCRHETVHPVAGYDGRARVHELQDALHVLALDVLQDNGDAVVRSGMAEKHGLHNGHGIYNILL